MRHEARGRDRGGLRLFAIFATSLLLPVAALGLLLDHTYRTDSTRRTLQAGIDQAQILSESAVVPAISDQDLTRGLDLPATADVGAAVDSSVREHRLVRLALISRQARTAFPPTELDRAVAGPAVAAALRGRATASIVRLTSVETTAYSYQGDVVKVDIPLVTPADRRVIGVQEVLLPYDRIAAVVRSQQRVFLEILAGALAVLYLLIAAICWVVTDRLRRQARISEHQSLHDALTGLPNRTMFRQWAERSVARAVRERGECVLVVVDLDRFKEVNDGLGHHCGDQLLVEVSRRIQGGLRNDDLVARLGGDEFGLVLPGTSLADALEVMARVRDLVRRPVELDGVEVVVDASIGLAACPRHGTAVPTLLQHADVAMYAAKAAGCGVVAYDDSDDGMGGRDKLGLLTDLRAALEHDELLLHYQPKVAVADGRVHGVEALVRWQHPRRGLLAPAAFLPVAEETGMVDAIFDWVLDRALADVAQTPGLQVAVNVSARTVHQAELVTRVRLALERHAVEARYLTLEMTETAAVERPDVAAEVLGGLRRLGVGVSLDDFGQGHTSLAYLRDLPLSELKIDRSFTARIASDEAEGDVVAAIARIAHRLGLQVVAEGVEDAPTLALLGHLECDLAQGYHLLRPAPLPQLLAWLRDGGRELAHDPAAAFVPATTARQLRGCHD